MCGSDHFHSLLQWHLHTLSSFSVEGISKVIRLPAFCASIVSVPLRGFPDDASYSDCPCTQTPPTDRLAHPFLPRQSHRPLRTTPQRRLPPQERHRCRHRPVLS